MAKKTTSLFEQHLEKIVIGVAGAALVTSAVYFFVMGAPYAESIWSGEAAGPADLGNKLQQVAAAAAQRSQQIPPPPPPTNVGGAAQKFKLDLPVAPAPAALAAYPSPLVGEGETGGSRKARPLVNVVAPSRPLAAAFRNVLQRPVQEPIADVAVRKALSGATEAWPTPPSNPTPGQDVARPWAMVAATLDLEAQRAAFRAAEYPPENWTLTAYDVDIERRQVVRLMDGDQYGPWEHAEAWIPIARPALPAPKFKSDGSLEPTDREELTKISQQLSATQHWILRPDALVAESGDRIKELDIPYLHFEPTGFFDESKVPGPQDPELKRMVGQWMRAAEDLLKQNSRDLTQAYIDAEAAYYSADIGKTDRQKAQTLLDALDKARTSSGGTAPKRELRRRMPMLAYDMNLEAGKSYQWRMRIRAINHYAGRPFSLANAEDSRKLLVAGAWSEPSAVVEVPTDVYMFLTKGPGTNTANGPSVTVEVFRQLRGGGKAPNKRYTGVRVGDTIGKVESRGRDGKVDFTTNAVVVDIDPKFMYRAPGSTGPAEPTVALIYTNAKQPGVLHELVLAEDGKSKKYQELVATGDKKPH